ncbi:hypothetical protein EHW70_28625, partial [Escherichia coli]
MQPRLLLRICFSRRTLKIGCLLLLIAGATIFIADRVMVNASKQLTWSDVNAVPARNVGLLLGARPVSYTHLTLPTKRIESSSW